MPEFPRYNSQAQVSNQIDTRPQEVMQTGAGDQAQIIGQAAGQMMDITMKWANAVDNMSETAIKANAATSLAQIKNDALLDPDINGEKNKIEQMKSMRSTVMGKGLQNKTAEQQLGMELDTQISLASLEINNIYAKKKIDFTKNTTIPTVIEGYHQTKQSTQYGSPQWQQADQALRADLEKWRASGIIDYGDMEKLYKQEQELGVKEDIASDTATQESQSQVLKDLKDPKGRYAFLDSKQRLALIEDTQRRIFQNNQTYKRDIETMQGVRNNALIDKAMNREITIADIEAELAIPESAGGMKRETLLKYQNGVLRGIQTDLNTMMKEKSANDSPTKRATMVEQYLGLIDNFIDDKSDQWKAREMLAQAWTDGVINSKEQKFLNDLKNNLKAIEWNRSTNPIASAIKGIKNFLGAQADMTDEERASRIKTLVGGMIEGTTPEAAQVKVESDFVKSRFPDYASYEKEGRVKLDKTSGRQYKVYPDGSWAWVTKTNKPESK
jgi:hypothetical protein